MGKTEEDCVRPGSDADLRAEQSRYPRYIQGLFFLSAGCTLNKIQKKKDFRITKNSKWEFQHSSLFFQRVLEDSFCC